MNPCPTVLGVDVSKATLELCLLKGLNEQVLLQRSLPNTQEAIEAFLPTLAPEAPASVCIALEPTGPYWYALANTAWAQGYRVVSVPTKETSKFLQARSERAKTDRIDAKGIACYALYMAVRDYHPKSQDVQHLESLLALRKKFSQTIADYTQAAPSLSAAPEVLAKVIQELKAQRKVVDGRIKEAVKPFEGVERLRKVPGFGQVVSAALIAKLIAFDFQSSDSFVAYIGLDIKVRDSGRFQGQRKLTHKGDPEMRRLLYLAAQASVRAKGSPYAVLYAAYRQRGLPTTVSLCAVARKLARTAWSILKFQTEYDPARVSKDLRATQTSEVQPCTN